MVPLNDGDGGMQEEPVEGRVTIVWDYTPPDFFGEPFVHESGDLRFEIGKGQVRVEAGSEAVDQTGQVADDLQQTVRNLFLGAQVSLHTPFVLSKPKVTRLLPDGTMTAMLTIFGAVTMTGTVDVRVLDAEGNVIAESAAERARAVMEFAELAARAGSSDAVAQALLGSYSRAVGDKANELVHLWEVAEALDSRFAGERRAQRSLVITKARWNTLGRLSNHEPLKQGRHRGEYPGQLRDATPAELEEARSIAREMILAYLRYLDAAGQRPTG